ncbi:YfhO family protein [Portibacter lacus]|uniref:Membrane protein n=1 Tax=Portibacter lacus TaxID=1099794 RepID=A0AA37WCT9_9BACT|nr:YfhO family protein [Portibacter lacus]GLR16213.1 membrane protein [Portibacter lacus]
MKFNWSKVIPHVSALAIFMFLAVVYFNPQLEGKKLPMGDITSFLGMSKEATDFEKETGEQTLWTNSMFGGMPTYQITARQKNNVAKRIEQVSQMFFDRPIGYFISGMVFFYIALILLGVNPWLSILGAIAFSFTTNNLVLFEAGHTSKIRALMASSMIIGGTILAYKNKLLLGAFAFTVGLAVNIYANHYQMTYYLGILLMIYVIFELVSHIKSGKLKDFGISSAVLLLCTFVALGTSASKLLTTMEFAEDTMRGKPIIETAAGDVTSSSQVDGLEFNYAMNWSNNALDLFSSYIPGFVGGGSAEPISKSSALAKSLKGRANIDKGPLYWGGLPSTSGPIYFGAVMFFLFIFGLFVVKGPIKWWMLSAVIVTFMFSMGKNLEWFNRFFFDYVPLFNKFRTPNSVLSVTAILIPFLGILGLNELFKSDIDKEDLIKKLYIAAGILLGSCVIFGLAGPALFDFSAPNDARYGQMGYDVNAIIKDRQSLLRSDSFRSFAFIALAAGLIWLYLKDKLKSVYVILGLSLFTIIDLFGIGKRYLNNDDFVSAREIQNKYQPRDVDIYIMKDTDPHFRVHDMTQDPFNSSFASYFHKTIGGYNPAKLQRAQDLIDYHISQGNMNVLNMLNTKYFITNNNEGKAVVQPNMQALGNAWFVEDIIMLKTNLEEINGLAGFDPNKTALVNSEFSNYFEGWTVSKSENARIQLTEYKPNKLTYTSTGTGDKLAVFSEMWYGPNKGWQAYLDGQPVDHIRVNYALRAMKVPAGSHTIVFEFDPQTYKLGTVISLISSLILVGLLGFMIFLYFKRKRK